MGGEDTERAREGEGKGKEGRGKGGGKREQGRERGILVLLFPHFVPCSYHTKKAVAIM